MNPAFSVIFFTTLSGAGYGVLTWLGALLATSRFDLFARGQAPGASLWLLLLALGLLLCGCALATIGLVSSLFHLGKPGRAWRAFSQWRTSWLSREGVLAMLTFVPAVWLGVLIALALAGADAGAARLQRLAPALGAAMAVLALITVACTAMIYASLTPIPAWRHQLVVPVYLAFAVLTGGLLLATLLALAGTVVGNLAAFAALLAALALAALKWRYWRDIDATPLPATRGAAVGLPGRTVSVFERPNTEANYITREMGFVLARKHARRLRPIALVLFAGVPALCMLPAWLLVHVDAAPWFAVAAASALAGAFVERWLFFAEAKHLVTLYY